ncbi:hypothetical protein [Pontibacter chitinilyticus]|uniref:hypothetical protein n=1 Tax=Pontibacter chitinilyticus TaxID=2674989 RepID=UPI00321BF764
MKTVTRFKTIGIALTLGLFTVACNQEARQDTNEAIDDAQVETTDAVADADANTNLEDFSNWVHTNTEKAETATADEWRDIDAEYNRREAELDVNSDTWDEKTKQEWQELKDDWKETKAKADKRLDVDVDVDTNNQ